MAHHQEQEPAPGVAPVGPHVPPVCPSSGELNGTRRDGAGERSGVRSRHQPVTARPAWGFASALMRVRFPPPSLSNFRKGFSFPGDCSKTPDAIRRAEAFFFRRSNQSQPDELLWRCTLPRTRGNPALIVDGGHGSLRHSGEPFLTVHSSACGVRTPGAASPRWQAGQVRWNNPSRSGSSGRRTGDGLPR